MKQVLPLYRYLPLLIVFSLLVPSAPPRAISVVAPDSSSLSISWSPPGILDINGVIRQYIVNVSVMDTLEHYQYTADNTSLIITELHPYYTYTVYVAAVTISIGPFSSGNTIRTPPNGM